MLTREEFSEKLRDYANLKVDIGAKLARGIVPDVTEEPLTSVKLRAELIAAYSEALRACKL